MSFRRPQSTFAPRGGPSCVWALAAVVLALAFAAPAIASEEAAETPPRPPEAPSVEPGERLGALVERVRWEQARIDTLEAEFTQRKESSFLVEPETARGVFSYAAPDRVRWEYLSPNPISLLIDGDRMTTWYRDLGQAERVEIGRQSQRVLEYLGASSSLSTLLEYFDVVLHMPGDPEEPYLLELEPRFARVAKRLTEMSIWVDRDLFLPVRLHYREPDGDSTEYEFANLRVNQGLPDELFELEIPADVEVETVSLDASGTR